MSTRIKGPYYPKEIGVLISAYKNLYTRDMAKKLSEGAALAKLRWDQSTPEEREETGARLTESRKAIPAEDRKAIAKQAAQARWDRVRAERAGKKATGKKGKL